MHFLKYPNTNIIIDSKHKYALIILNTLFTEMYDPPPPQLSDAPVKHNLKVNKKTFSTI